MTEKEITEKAMTENEKEQECCEEYEVHENLLEIVKQTMPEEEELNDLAELFKIFGDATRIRILLSCLRRKCVSAIWRKL